MCSEVTFGQIKSQEAREADHSNAGQEVRRRVADELVNIWEIERGEREQKGEQVDVFESDCMCVSKVV